MMERFLPDGSCFLQEVCDEDNLKGLEEKKDVGNKCARMWERKHNREGCHRMLSANLTFMVRISREAREPSGVFISSSVQARPGAER